MSLVHIGPIVRAIGAETDHLKPLTMIAPIERVQNRHFLAAGRTPGGPEVYDYDFAAQRAQIECLTIQLLDHQRRGRLTDLRGRPRARA